MAESVKDTTPLALTRRALLHAYYTRRDVVESFDRVCAFIRQASCGVSADGLEIYLFRDPYGGTLEDLGVSLDSAPSSHIPYRVWDGK